jgi:hypothetical protein
MKKIALIASAVSAALFASATASAEVKLTGSAGLGVVSGDSTNKTRVYNGGGVSFALSSDLGNGVTVSTSAGITQDSNDSIALGATATGLSNISFATGGATITVGGDIDIAGDGVGEVGGVAGDLVDEGGYNSAILGMGGLTQEDGYGVSLSTAIGSATLTASYIMDSSGEQNFALTDDTDTATGFQVSMPMGSLSTTLGWGNDEANSETVVGGTVAYTADFGTVTAGMADKNGNTDTSTWGLAYSGTLGSAGVKVGYTSGKSGSSNSTRTEASISQSIGAGASVYLDVSTASGAGVTSNDKGTNIAIGTSFSF